MDVTPTRRRQTAEECASSYAEDQENLESPRRSSRIKKPPPITPRRFNKFFTPRARNAGHKVKTSRTALRSISSSVLNSKQRNEDETEPSLPASLDSQYPYKKRKYSVISGPTSMQSSPISKSDIFLPSSQEPIRSSPLRNERSSPTGQKSMLSDDDDVSTEDEDDYSDDDCGQDEDYPRIATYNTQSTSRSRLKSRLDRRIPQTRETGDSSLWQNETAHFFSSPEDINSDLQTQSPAALPFSVASCHTNPTIATGDEDGNVRLLDTEKESRTGFGRPIVSFRPHDNALMDLEFSPDDTLLATVSGDQTCQIIDVVTQKSLYLLSAHTSSVKRIQFQPGSSNKVLASCGRDGQINYWDLRVKGTSMSQSPRYSRQAMPGAENACVLSPVNSIHDAHTAGSKFKSATASTRSRPNNVPGRHDFSITSLSFLDSARPHLVATASEVDTVVKIWDMRVTYSDSRHKNRLPVPLACTQEPASHELHRRFGINSIAVSSDSSRLYALSRDHSVYVYSTAHLILGCSPSTQSASSSIMSRSHRPGSETIHGGSPLYALRHPSLRLATFWPRLAIRRSSDSGNELLAVGSTDDCAVVFPTNERYLTNANKNIPPLAQTDDNPATSSFLSSSSSSFARRTASRPTLSRMSSSFRGFAPNEEPHLPVYYHGTPLTRGHTKEVTSLTWTTEGNLITASDDYTVRCWRESPQQAREMRRSGDRTGQAWRKGWADVGVKGFDDDDLDIFV